MSVTAGILIVVGGIGTVVFTVLLFLLPGRFKRQIQELLDYINNIDIKKQEKSIMDKFMSTENVAQTDTETK